MMTKSRQTNKPRGVTRGVGVGEDRCRMIVGTQPARVRPGASHPLAAAWDASGVNFAPFSEHATRVELCLFDSTEARGRAFLLGDRSVAVFLGVPG